SMVCTSMSSVTTKDIVTGAVAAGTLITLPAVGELIVTCGAVSSEPAATAVMESIPCSQERAMIPKNSTMDLRMYFIFCFLYWFRFDQFPPLGRVGKASSSACG